MTMLLQAVFWAPWRLSGWRPATASASTSQSCSWRNGASAGTTPPSPSMPLDVALRAARVRDDRPLVDIGIVGARIVSVAPEMRESARTDIQCDGRVVLPGLVESHLHLDKAFLADRQPNQSGTLAEAIRVTGVLKASITADDIRDRAERALLLAIRHGTTTIRAETEFDPVIGLMGIRALLDLKQRYAWAVDLQVVAFPQEGVHKTPGTEALFWQAMELGAD